MDQQAMKAPSLTNGDSGIIETASSLPGSLLDPSIIKAITDGDVDTVDQFLEARGNLDATDDKKRSLLHYTTANNQLKIMKKLLQCDVNPNAADLNGWTPLHVASRFNNRDAVRMLIEAGASRASRTNAHLCLPIHVAAQSGSVDALQELLCSSADADADAMSLAADNYTPLHYAAQSDHVKVIQCLLSLDCKYQLLEMKTSKDGCTAVHVASLHGKRNALQELMSSGGSPRLKTKSGMDCYGLSAQRNHRECMKMLSEPCNAGTVRIEHTASKEVTQRSWSAPDGKTETSMKPCSPKLVKDCTKVSRGSKESGDADIKCSTDMQMNFFGKQLAEVKDMVADVHHWIAEGAGKNDCIVGVQGKVNANPTVITLPESTDAQLMSENSVMSQVVQNN